MKQSRKKMAKFSEFSSQLYRSIPGSSLSSPLLWSWLDWVPQHWRCCCTLIAMGMGLSPPLPIHLPCVLPPLRERHYFPSSSVGRSASWALVAVAFRPSASKRRGAPVWALRLPTPYWLRLVPGSRRRSDPRRLRPASHIRGSPCPCAVYRARPCCFGPALRRFATTSDVSPVSAAVSTGPRNTLK